MHCRSGQLLLHPLAAVVGLIDRAAGGSHVVAKFDLNDTALGGWCIASVTAAVLLSGRWLVLLSLFSSPCCLLGWFLLLT